MQPLSKNRAFPVAAVVVLLFLPATAAAQHGPITIDTITAQPGTTASGELEVPARGGEPGTTIPISIVHGSRPGPVLVLTAAVHGYEYPPVLALQRLRKTLDPTMLSGTVVLVHVANMPSFLKRTVYYSPVDWKNLNRVFPGNADGTISERIADVLTRQVIDRATHVIDLHCGDGNESLRPYVYWVTTGEPPVAEEGRQLALAFGIDHIVIDSARPSDPGASLYVSNTAITRGKPALTIESGALGQSDEESIVRIERGIAGVLKHLKMQASGPEPVKNPVWIGRNEVLRSQSTGLFYAAVERGHWVAEGTLIGTITDFFGRTLEEIRSPFAGVVLYVIGTPPISEGEPLAYVGAPATQAELKLTR
jgi:uncharacterized protein